MATYQQKGKAAGPGASPSTNMTLRLRPAERAALGRVMLSHHLSVSDAIRMAIIDADKRASEKALETPLEIVAKDTLTTAKTVEKMGNRLEHAIEMLHAKDPHLEAMEQALRLVVGAVMSSGLTAEPGQADRWLINLGKLRNQYEKGVLGKFLEDRIAKAASRIQEG